MKVMLKTPASLISWYLSYIYTLRDTCHLPSELTKPKPRLPKARNLNQSTLLVWEDFMLGLRLYVFFMFSSKEEKWVFKEMAARMK